MATAYRFARIVAPDGVNPIRSTTITAKLPGTSTTVTLYTDPTLATVLSGAGQFTTDVNGFAQWATTVGTVDFYNGSTLIESNVSVPRFDPVDAPLNASGGLSSAYTGQAGFALDGSPSGVYYANMSRRDAGTDLAAFTSNTMLSTAIWLPAGAVVTNLTFVSGATAAAGPTHSFAALYSTAATPALLANSADATNTVVWAAETAYTYAMSSPYTVTTSGVYYAALSITDGTTMPSIVGIGRAGAGASKAVISGNKQISQTSGSSLNGTPPATITGSTASGKIPLVIVT